MTEILLHRKIRIAVGLRWFPLSVGDDSRPKAELVELAQSKGVHKPTHGVLLTADSATHGSWIYGGVLDDKAPPGARDAYSGAAWLTKLAREQAILVVQRMPGRDERWWIVLVRRAGMVDPSTDVILGDEQASLLIDNLLRDAHQTAGEEVRVLIGGQPPSQSQYLDALPWESDGAQSNENRRVMMDYQAYVGLDERPPSDTRIRQIAGVPRTAIMLMVGVLLIGIGLVGGMQYLKWVKAQKTLADMQARMAAEQGDLRTAATLRELRIREAVAKALESDTATPLPSAVIERCRAVLDQTQLAVAGWLIKSIDCDSANDKARIVLTRTDASTNQNVVAWIDAQGWSIKVDVSGREAVASAPLAPLTHRPSLRIDALPTMEGLALREGSLLQIADRALGGVQNQMTNPTPKALTYLDPDKESASAASERYVAVPAAQSYQAGKITLSGDGLWVLQQKLVSDATYMTMQKLTLDPQNDKYKIEVTYVVSN